MTSATGVAVVFLATLLATPCAIRASTAGDAALAKFSAAWDAVHTYTCAISAHEVRGSDVQDRVYHVAFARPHTMRADIVAGAGRGGAAIWTGGDTLYGHQGGFLSFVRMHLNIHDPRAVSLRGTTVAQVSFGALLERFEHLKTSALDAKEAGGLTTVTAAVSDPDTEMGVTAEVLILGANHIPVEYDQYQGERVVDRVRYSDYKENVPLPASTWKI
ncbi:MAG TPA: hypothetical protein VJN22_02705 [Candidatus Eremiobacteraceae bacterium]|nr:hypothetical protein [Candidatus Eremiobacteraceae bacterium]